MERVREAAQNAWYENSNYYQTQFEKAFASYVGRKYAISLPSCTSALHLALLGLGIGAGDEVIVPDITWIASSAPIHYTGARPVFADIDAASWCLSPQSFEQNISRKTKAVIAVDLYGNMPEMKQILSIARKRGIAVIEDAAEAIGSEYRGKKAGGFGIASAFSFHGSKTLTTGEGGMLVTDSKRMHHRAMMLRDHGRMPGDILFRNKEVAYKYKMSALQAALGWAQLERIDELVERKREIFSWYREYLENAKGITLNTQSGYVKNTYWMVTLMLDKKPKLKKERLIRLLRKRGVDCRPFFYPLSSLPAYAKSPQARKARLSNKTAYQLSGYGINLPSALRLTRQDVAFVCSQVQELIA